MIDADVSKFFDTIPFSHLRSFLDLWIKDGVVRRMIDKWLNAGVLEEDTVRAALDGDGHDVRFSRLHPRMGTVETRQGCRAPDHGQGTVRPRAEIGA